MAKKTKKVSKAAEVKLAKALETIRAFSTEEASLNGVALRDIYQVNKDSLNQITFTLDFRNFGVSAVTDSAVLHDVNGTDKTLVSGVTGSILNEPVGTNEEANGKFLNILSSVMATNETPVPQDLKVDFSITGGAAPRNYTIPNATFNSVGDRIIIDISIFFFHV